MLGRRTWTRWVSAVLLVLSLASLALTALGQLELTRGGSLAILLGFLAGVVQALERFLRDRTPDWDQQIEQERREIERRAPGERRRVLGLVRQYAAAEDLLGRYWDRRQRPPELGRLELRLVSRQRAVEGLLSRPFDEADRPLQRGVSIGAVFRQVQGQLLVLGDPGAGKTTCLYELAQALLFAASRIADEPIPVILSLASWAVHRQDLTAWLAGELYRRYRVPRLVGQYWLRGRQVVLLLDGLDEVRAEHREACLRAINRFLDDPGAAGLVVCCRAAEYEALPVKLRLEGAVVIQPLTWVEVEDYLAREQGPHRGALRALAQDESMRQLLTSPLFLHVAAITYPSDPAAAVRPGVTLEERRRLVFEDYVAAALRRRPPDAGAAFSDEATVSWLTWLARSMLMHAQSVLYLDWLQPDWLPDRTQRRLVTAGTAAAAGLVGGLLDLAGSMLISQRNGLFDWAWSGLAGGLIFGPIIGLAAYASTITPTERLRWSWAALLHGIPRLLVAGMLAGTTWAIVSSVILAAVLPMSLGELVVLTIGGLAGMLVLVPLVTVLVFGPVSALRPQLYAAPAGPGEGMRTSRRNALRGGLTGGLIGVLTGALLGCLIGLMAGPLISGLPPDLLPMTRALGRESAGLNLVLSFALSSALDLGLTFGLVAWLRRGGGAYLRHQALRWLLVRDGAMPWDYKAFLDHASGLCLLQPRGGGYEFMHRLLLEYFAALVTAPPGDRGRRAGVSSGQSSMPAGTTKG